MTVAILIPAMRPQNFARIVDNLAETTSDDFQIYWVVGTGQAADELARLKQTYWVDDGDTWGHRLNFLFEHTTEPYFFLGADDLRWHEDWLDAAMLAMEKVDGVVSVNDLWQHGIGTSALVSRNYINSMSGCVDSERTLIHPGYFHNASESELYETAMSRDRFAYCAESVVEHLHFTLGKSPDDEVYALGSVHTDDDVALYRSRRHLWGGTWWEQPEGHPLRRWQFR